MLRRLVQHLHRPASIALAGLVVQIAATSFHSPVCDALEVAKPGQAEKAASLHSGKLKPRPRRVFKSTDEILTLFGEKVRATLKPLFNGMNVSYPPGEMTWVCLKQEKVLLLFAKGASGKQVQVLCYPIVGSSGGIGPKLKEGDMQIPEGFYRIPTFHPNVIAHMALDVNYPNDEDRAHAIAEHRKKLGCDILIHGSRWSSGCLAMGNIPMEEMYVLAYDCGIKNIQLIFAPCNLVVQEPQVDFKKQPVWLPSLYKRIKLSLQVLPIDTSNIPRAETLEETRASY